MRAVESRTLLARRLMYAGIAAFCAQASTNACANDTTSANRDSQDENRNAENSPAQTGPLGFPVVSAAEQAAISVPTDPYAHFKKYVSKGFNVPIPGPSAYIDPDPAGFRSTLADHGFGYWGYSLNAWTYDLQNSSKVDGRQVYVGQRPTLTSYNYLYGTYDLSRHGIENGQISAALANVYTTWAAAGPNMTRIGVLQYYQTFGDGKVEMTVGNLANSFTYVGIYVGGNLASGTFGVNASIPSQVGMSSTFLARPGANFKFDLGGGFYDMVGVQRSVNPDGAAMEQDQNKVGVEFGGDNIGNLYINELGFRRSAAPGKSDTWVRTGYFRNTSDFNSRKTPETRDDGNYAAYLLADRQVFSLADSPTQVARGIYAGFSVMHAPADINTFTNYGELRIYAKGLFDRRPSDMLSFVMTHTEFSDYAVDAARAAGSPTENASSAVSLSYSGQVYRGITLTAGFSYIDHPRPVATSDEQDSGVNFQLGAHIYF